MHPVYSFPHIVFVLPHLFTFNVTVFHLCEKHFPPPPLSLSLSPLFLWVSCFLCCFDNYKATAPPHETYTVHVCHFQSSSACVTEEKLQEVGVDFAMHLLMKIKMALKVSSVNSLEAVVFVRLFVLYLHLYPRELYVKGMFGWGLGGCF